MENTPITVQRATISSDLQTVHLSVSSLVPEKIYELHFDNLRAKDGMAPLHPVAYYTLNRLVAGSKK
jgi:hypothetical protein